MMGSVGVLVLDVPAPGRDHRKDELSTLVEKGPVEARIVPGNLSWHVYSEGERFPCDVVS